MPEFASIDPVKRLACPHCRSLLDEELLLEALEGKSAACPHCGEAVKLPQDVVERYQRKKYVGRSLDIVG